MNLIVNIDSYLAELRAIESSVDPKQRRVVPTQSELARMVGVSQSGLSKILNNRVDLINRHIIARIIHVLREEGFNTQVGDILVYVEDSPSPRRLVDPHDYLKD